jgi:hypothetical protein
MPNRRHHRCADLLAPLTLSGWAIAASSSAAKASRARCDTEPCAPASNASVPTGCGTPRRAAGSPQAAPSPDSWPSPAVPAPTRSSAAPEPAPPNEPRWKPADSTSGSSESLLRRSESVPICRVRRFTRYRGGPSTQRRRAALLSACRMTPVSRDRLPDGAGGTPLPAAGHSYEASPQGLPSTGTARICR